MGPATPGSGHVGRAYPGPVGGIRAATWWDRPALNHLRAGRANPTVPTPGTAATWHQVATVRRLPPASGKTGQIWHRFLPCIITVATTRHMLSSITCPVTTFLFFSPGTYMISDTTSSTADSAICVDVLYWRQPHLFSLIHQGFILLPCINRAKTKTKGVFIFFWRKFLEENLTISEH